MKNIDSLFSLFLLVCIFVSCSTTGISSNKYTFDKMYSYSSFNLNSARKPWSMQVNNYNKRSGDGSVRFELRGNDGWYDGFKMSSRTELSEHRVRPLLNKDVWYGFSMFIPSHEFPENQSNQIICGQWHQDSKSGWPILSQHYDVKNETLVIDFRPGNFWIDKFGYKQYTKDRGLWKLKGFKMDRWNDLVYNVKWTKENDGYLNIWWNGQQIIQYSGITYFDGERRAPYFKLGLYVAGIDASWKTNTHVIYFDEYARGGSYEEVAPK
jgi:hypothetical protein